jgi:hypothetical protein
MVSMLSGASPEITRARDDLALSLSMSMYRTNQKSYQETTTIETCHGQPAP